MKANAPEKLYVDARDNLADSCLWGFIEKSGDEDIEYTRTDAFIERAAKFLYNYNQKQVLKHGARATLGCGEYTINVEEFRNYMKGE